MVNALSRFLYREFWLMIFISYKFKATATNTTSLEKCPTDFDTINLLATDFFPYLKRNGNSSFEGELEEYVSKSIKKCCSKIKLNYRWVNITASDDIELTVRRYNDNHPLMFFPVFAKRNEHKQFERKFIELYQSPGFAVLQIAKNTAIDNATKQLNALMDTWSIVAICLLAAILAGTLVWILDCRKNSDFSPKFFDGAGAGIWWSFVTMTTVGYGDKSPKSALARFFAIVWMIVGTVILSIFSAQITASIAAFDINKEFSLHNKMVAVPLGMQNYLEKEINLGGVYYEFSSHDVTKAALSGNVSSINGTQYVILHDFDLFLTWIFDNNKTLNATVKTFISHRMSLGVVVTHVDEASSESFFKCWKQYAADQISISKLQKRDKYRERLHDMRKYDSSDSKSLELKIIYGLAGVAGCFLAFGMIWELFRRNKYTGTSATVSNPA